MNGTNKTLLVTAIIVILSLSIYSFILKQQINNNKTKIDELTYIINTDKSITLDNKIKLEKYNKLLQEHHKDYVSRKKFDLHVNYIKYKKTITALIDEQIAQIVTEKPLQQGKWILTKIEFLNPAFAYVEYEDGHGLSATFIQIQKTETGYDFTAIY